MVLPTICINLLSMNSYIWFYEAILQMNFQQIHSNRCWKQIKPFFLISNYYEWFYEWVVQIRSTKNLK